MLFHLWLILWHLFRSILRVLRVVLSGMVNCYIRVMKQYLNLNVSYILWMKLLFEKIYEWV